VAGCRHRRFRVFRLEQAEEHRAVRATTDARSVFFPPSGRRARSQPFSSRSELGLWRVFLGRTSANGLGRWHGWDYLEGGVSLRELTLLSYSRKGTERGQFDMSHYVVGSSAVRVASFVFVACS